MLTTPTYYNINQINPYDRFGQTMMTNLRHRGCSLLGIDACPDLVAQVNKGAMNTINFDDIIRRKDFLIVGGVIVGP